MTSKSQHNPDTSDRALDRNKPMSEDRGDGGRRAAEKRPEEEAQDQSAIEAFGEEGAGVAAKE